MHSLTVKLCSFLVRSYLFMVNVRMLMINSTREVNSTRFKVFKVIYLGNSLFEFRIISRMNAVGIQFKSFSVI